jgi:hypothetical protein
MNEEVEELPASRSAASMAAFDAMPEAWRKFCADYSRTAPGQQLAEVLAECRGDVAAAKRLLRYLLPAEAAPKRRKRRRV